MGLLAPDLDVERGFLEIGAMVCDLEAELVLGHVVALDDCTESCGHRCRRGLHQTFRPASELVLVIVPDGVNGERGPSALGGVLGHHYDLIHLYAEAFGLLVQILMADVHVRYGHHDIVAIGAVCVGTVIAHILPIMESNQPFFHIH